MKKLEEVKAQTPKVLLVIVVRKKKKEGATTG